ncbi:hypothetical protein [Gudongella sp. DL1XJH-153]|uniref:hypothetical protein n=1 Tax=Gudongella sp. DL1XJH-153 TaxID=3409804 RepID=UPI003BB7441D
MNNKKYLIVVIIVITIIAAFSSEHELPSQEDRLNCSPAFPENPVKQSIINNSDQTFIEIKE